MNHRTRRAINLLANHIEDAAAALVGWLRAKAERKPRPRPLCFPSPFEEMMERLTGAYVQRIADRMVRDILAGPKIVRITDDIPYVVPGERKADPYALTPITYSRYPIYTDGI